jgi:hypothetical protein
VTIEKRCEQREADHGDTWPDLKFNVASPLARVAPGRYVARSGGLRSFTAYGRRGIRIDFDLYMNETAFQAGNVLARGVPMYFRLPKGSTLSRSSKLARAFAVAGISLSDSRRVPLNHLKGKLWLVEVGDVLQSNETTVDGRHVRLPDQAIYSVIRRLMERLA